VKFTWQEYQNNGGLINLSNKDRCSPSCSIYYTRLSEMHHTNIQEVKPQKSPLKVIKKEEHRDWTIKYFLSNWTHRRYKGKVRIIWYDENIDKILQEIADDISVI